jgi:hypothetical protein
MRGAVVAFDWEESMLPLDGAATSADGAASSEEEDEEGGRFWLRAPGRAEQRQLFRSRQRPNQENKETAESLGDHPERIPNVRDE